MLARYCDVRWTALLEGVKKDVSSHEDANPDPERCKTTWESYAHLHWHNDAFPAGRLERDLVDPACERSCANLSEFELTTFLAWRWHEYLEETNPGVSSPWLMHLSIRRLALTGVLQESARQLASAEGAEFEDRGYR